MSVVAYLSKQKIFYFIARYFSGWIWLSGFGDINNVIRSSLYFFWYTSSALLSFFGKKLEFLSNSHAHSGLIAKNGHHQLSNYIHQRESFFDLALFIFQTLDLSLLCRGWLICIDHSSLEPSDWQRSLECVFHNFTKTACYQDGRISQGKMNTEWLRKRAEAKATDDHCKSWQRPVYHNRIST